MREVDIDRCDVVVVERCIIQKHAWRSVKSESNDLIGQTKHKNGTILKSDWPSLFQTEVPVKFRD